MSMRTSVTRFGGASAPMQPNGLYVGVITSVIDSSYAKVRITALNSVIGPCRSVNGLRLEKGARVVCGFLDGKLSDAVIIASVSGVGGQGDLETLTITNTGTGNSLVIEDSASVDATPVVIDANGTLIVGHTADLGGGNLQIIGTDSNRLSLYRYSADTGNSQLNLMKSRNSTNGAHTAVQSGDGLGLITFRGSDGTSFSIAAQIQALAEGTVSSGIVPGRIKIETASASGAMTERLAIDSSGTTNISGSLQVNGIGIGTASPNYVINGGFDVWQRATSYTGTPVTGTINYVTADRWTLSLTGTAAQLTTTRQNADTTGLIYGHRFGRSSGQTAVPTTIIAGHIMETRQSRPMAGRTVTLSFYAKAGANAPSTLVSQIYTSTGIDQAASGVFSGGWTGVVNNTQNNTVSTTMARYSHTVTLGSTVNQIFISFYYAPSGTAGANEWFQVEGVQLEVASAPSLFKRSGTSIAEEIDLCQRYYFKLGPGIAGSRLASGFNTSTTIGNYVVNFPTRMRVAPTAIETSGTAADYEIAYTTTSTACSAVPTYQAGTDMSAGIAATVSSGLTAGQGSLLRLTGTAGYLAWSAEL